MNLLKYKKILETKFYFELPKKKPFLIFDQTGSDNIKKNLPQNSYFVLHTRLEKLNLLVLIKMLFKLKLSNKSYIKEYIKTCCPKAIIT